jgi:putative transposon-encoded protein
MNSEMVIQVQGFQVLERKVKSAKTTGRIYLPKEWIGKQVKIVLLEHTTEEEKEDE